MGVLSTRAGHVPTASELAGLVPRFVRKTADESVTSNATSQDDDELFLSVDASTTYVVTGQIYYVGIDTADLRWCFNAPAGSTLHMHLDAPGSAAVTGAGTTGSVEFFPTYNSTTFPSADNFAGASTTNMTGRLTGLLVTGATAGTLRFRWAQLASIATALTVRAGSWLLAQKVA